MLVGNRTMLTNGTVEALADLLVSPARAELEKTTAAFKILFEVIVNALSGRVGLSLLVMFVVYRLYTLLFAPMKRILNNHEVGYIADRNQSLEERARDVRRRRRTGDLPPVFPNGWFAVANSRDIARGEAKQVTCLGLELAVFRSEAGEIAILDAYCPHLGANLAAGGTVKGDTLSCPFHGWSFDKSGVCVKIPYCDHIPSGASVKSYTVLERNGHILIWHDAEGREPYWHPPVIEGILKGEMTCRGEAQHSVNCHIQETPENGADVPHLEYLHGPSIFEGSDLRYIGKPHMKFVCHTWDADWKPGEDDGKHLSHLTLVHSLKIFGIEILPVRMDLTVTQVGPALVYLEWKTLLGRVCYVHSLTPTEPLLQRTNFLVFADRFVPTFMAKIYLKGEAIQLERDILVWNNKMYRNSPVLCKGDSLIKKHRLWYSQFYSEHSPTYEEAIRKSLDW
eukprot:m.161041 g.161041  ORF g.161041 m.161041 type:complete len:452 (+) comp53035_c0_seq1:204-1559(+)